MSGGPEVARFRNLLAKWLGWTFDAGDTDQLVQVLDERATNNELSRAAYLYRLGAGEWADEIVALTESLSITETYFFRHSAQFRALRETALPQRVVARSSQRILRLLSVACSSGEEAYTLAIVGRQVQPDPQWIINVIGLDANPAVLRRADAGRYSTWSLRETPDPVRRRWFHPSDDGFAVREEIRSLVRFRQYNVADNDVELWRPNQYDVIFCRNLLMYLTADMAADLIRRMTKALAPGGFLFLGHTDSLGSRPEGLEPQQSHHTFYYRRVADVASRAALVPQRASIAYPAAPTPVAMNHEYQRALRLLHDDRFAEALEVSSTVAQDPDSGDREPYELLIHGVLLAHAGRFREAIDTARRLIALDGLYANAHQLFALGLEGDGTVDEAISQYRLAAYLDPSFALPRLRLGQLARRRRDEPTAAAELRRALELLAQESDERITLFGGGFGRMALTVLCRTELDSTGARR